MFLYAVVPTHKGVYNENLVKALERVGRGLPGRGSSFAKGVAIISKELGPWFSKSQIKNLCRSKKSRYKVSKKADIAILAIRRAGICDGLFPVGECFPKHCMPEGCRIIEQILFGLRVLQNNRDS